MAATTPGFVFYPGDYLRDTQCLSEASQVAYDRIMCEHLRASEDMNIICISYDKHKFFTKRLTPDQKEELNHVLKDIGTGFQIEWVVQSILKTRAYSESRSKNRKGKKDKKSNNISISYDIHMDNDNDNDNVINKKGVRFEKPTINHVKEYFGLKGFANEAEAFYDFYESKNWMVGKNKMVKWQAAASGWMRRTFKEKNNGNTTRFKPEHEQRANDRNARAREILGFQENESTRV